MIDEMSYSSPSPSGRGSGVRENRLDVNSSLRACVMECAPTTAGALSLLTCSSLWNGIWPLQTETGVARSARSRSPYSASPPNSSSLFATAMISETSKTDFKLRQGYARYKSSSAAPVNPPEIGISLEPTCWNLDVCTILRPPFHHSCCTHCVAKLYPVTAYSRLLQPITAKQHSREKHPQWRLLNSFSKNISRYPQATCRNSKLKNNLPS
jgi:hypothetical protein